MPKLPVSSDTIALLGGPPAFTDKLHVGRPNIGDKARFLERVEDILERRWLTNDGPYVQAFERRVAELCGTRHCIAMANGTIGLEIMMRAAGLSGEVIVPAFTFVATAHALQWQEIRPIFCDVDPRTHCLDPARVEELITPLTTGVVAVHCWGQTAAVAELQEICDRRGLKLLFDAAHAFGCAAPAALDAPGARAPRMIGSMGDAECFSFHATKIVNCFEGGAVTTNDDELAEKMRLMRNFGFHGKDNVVYVGSNGKMSEVSAAMGLTSIDGLEPFVARNRENYLAYREAFAGVDGLTVFEHDGSRPHNFHYVVVEVDEERFGLDRNALVSVLEAENVLARRYFFPGVHRMEPYRSLQPQAGLVLRETEALSRRVMTLPTGDEVTPQICRRIVNIIASAGRCADEVRAHLDAKDEPPTRGV